MKTRTTKTTRTTKKKKNREEAAALWLEVNDRYYREDWDGYDFELSDALDYRRIRLLVYWYRRLADSVARFGERVDALKKAEGYEGFGEPTDDTIPDDGEAEGGDEE